MGRILIGISSWAERGLVKSSFYPKEEVKTPADMLRYYAMNFPIVESDMSYHVLLPRRNSTLWVERTPPGFIFNLKAFRLFSQHPTPPGSLPADLRGQITEKKENFYINRLPQEIVEEIRRRFKEAVRPIKEAGKLEVVFFQFPPWFHPNQANQAYLKECREKFPEYRLAVEFRAPSWLEDEHKERTLSLLKEQQMALVCVDEPQGLKTSMPPIAEVTAPIGLVRFHGRNRENWERQDVMGEKFKYLYNEDELKEWVPKIRHLAESAEEVHVIFKNKFSDYPVQNARQMKQLLG